MFGLRQNAVHLAHDHQQAHLPAGRRSPPCSAPLVCTRAGSSFAAGFVVAFTVVTSAQTQTMPAPERYVLTVTLVRRRNPK